MGAYIEVCISAVTRIPRFRCDVPGFFPTDDELSLARMICQKLNDLSLPLHKKWDAKHDEFLSKNTTPWHDEQGHWIIPDMSIEKSCVAVKNESGTTEEG